MTFSGAVLVQSIAKFVEYAQMIYSMFTPKSFRSKRPEDKSQWLCELNAQEVVFKQFGNPEINRFAQESFLLDRQFPMPA